MNNKGQLSIIAALLVAVVLVGTILVTFSKIRDSSIQESPQILSAIDEIDLAIDQILSSTIRYYGSVLKVTGNSSYARSSAQSFLYNETKNIPSMYPGWGISLSVRDVKLRVNWFSNYSYSSGTLAINYDLEGLGLSNINYNSSSSLMVQTNNETTASRARLTVTRDLGSPVANLGRQNFGFYSYNYTNSTWNVISPNTLSTTFTNGTYVIDLPQGVDSDFYVVQVEDQRGLMVISSSSSFLANGLNWNNSLIPTAHYVDNNVSNVDSTIGIGSHSNFAAQQSGPDSIYDTLTEGLASETQSPTYYPSSYNLLGSTQLVSGTLSNLQADDGVCMTFRSYQTPSSSQTLYAHAETTNIGGTPYYLQKLVSADGTATDLSASMSTTGRKAMGKFVYPLTGVSSIPASTWTVYYRAYGTASNTHSLRATGGYMRVGDGTPNWGSVSGTISFWVKWNTVANRTWGQHENMETRMSGSNLILDWGGSGSLTSTTSFVAGTWYFIAIVWNQNTDRLYLYIGDQSNSPALDAQATWTGSVSSVGVTQNNFMASKGGVEPLNGYGDELRYWNTDRNLASIQSDYKTELSGSESNLRSYFKLNNNFNDAGPNQSNGSGLGSYSFSSDVPFAKSSTAHGDVNILIRASDGTIRQTVATDVANSNNVGGSWSTLSGTYSWVNYTIADQTDYLEIDYYMHVTSAGGETVYLKVDDPALNIIDQTRVSGVMLPSEYTVEAEFTGISDTQSWNQLVWTIDSGFTTTDVTAAFQLYNYTAGAYSTSGDGYITDTIGTANVTKTQIITINPTGFRDASGNWRLKVKGVKTTTAQFDWRGDLVQYRVNYTTSDYRLDLEEQWTNVDYSQTDQLAIYARKGNPLNANSLAATGGYMIIGNGSSNWGSVSGTISFWVKWNTVANRTWGQHENMETRMSGSNLILDWGGSGSITSITSFVADRWYFIGIVWNENTHNLYLYVGDQNSTPTLDAQNTNWLNTVSTAGVTQNNFMASKGGVEPLNGYGDDLRYWSVDRSLSSIQSDCKTELSGSESNLRSYFKMNNDFSDYGPNHNNGTGSGSYSFSSDVPFVPPTTENLRVDVWNGTAWNNLFTDLTDGWNNASVSSYLTSSNFTIRFNDGNQTGDAVQDGWQVDVALLRTNTSLYGQLQDATIAVELLQNGTMLWLGQEMTTTKVRPIPPIPVKSFHVNQTINGIDREVPYQIEDWASSYRIPLGLSSNSSVFSSRSMLVYLVTPRVSGLTVWWNGSDETIQTPYAYTNQYFTVNTVQRTVTNGILNLRIDSDGGTFKVVSTAGTSSCTSEVFRINSVVAGNGSAEPNYAITNGPVRAVIHHEVEWSSGGIPNCPDTLAHLVLTLPANATYYTYALRLMFLSTQQTRTITDLCPIKLTTTISLIQTENGTATGYPIVTNTTGLFYNLSQSVWAHHWSQFISGTKGAGIMFTNVENQRLYVFDSPSTKTGALKTDSGAKKIELLPVTMSQISLPNAFDVTWHGAIVTFDGTTPIYKEDLGTKTGLWVIVEYPPSLT
jgi:hypothetical protein